MLLLKILSHRIIFSNDIRKRKLHLDLTIFLHYTNEGLVLCSELVFNKTCFAIFISPAPFQIQIYSLVSVVLHVKSRLCLLLTPVMGNTISPLNLQCLSFSSPERYFWNENKIISQLNLQFDSAPDYLKYERFYYCVLQNQVIDMHVFRSIYRLKLWVVNSVNYFTDQVSCNYINYCFCNRSGMGSI